MFEPTNTPQETPSSPAPSVQPTKSVYRYEPRGNAQGKGNQGRNNNNRQQRPSNQGPQPAGQRPDQNKGRQNLRLYPLGGFEQVGRNCFVIEVDDDIYIIDLGLQFPDEDMMGIDYLIPDMSSLKGRENRIKAVLFTHGHLDHIGAVQHLLPQLHFPHCYGTKLTMAFVKKRLDEEKLTSKANLHTVNFREKIRIGKVEVEFLRVTHSIPDSAAVVLHTPYGKIVHTGDFKFDLTPMNEPPADFHRLAEWTLKINIPTVYQQKVFTKPLPSELQAESIRLFDLQKIQMSQ
jgi:glyoxylase-like metal-dependent hydrolase (beta-lactamase superfamily II)